MMHYKPLYGNPMNLGNIDDLEQGIEILDDLEQEIESDLGSEVIPVEVDVPTIFTTQDSAEAWVALLQELAREGIEFDVLNPVMFNILEEAIQMTIHDGVRAWHSGEDGVGISTITDMLQNADLTLPVPEIEGADEIDSQDSPEELARANMVLQGLTEVYGQRDFVNSDIEIYPVLYEAAVGIEEALGVSGTITSAHVAEALEYFNNIAFPDYQPEELVAALYFVVSGAVDTLDAEEESMITDDSRVDALCSDRNEAIILAAFGVDAAAKFIQFCNADAASRKLEWEDVAGRNIAKLLDVDNAAFEQYVFEAFDSATSEILAGEGSDLLQELVGGVVREPEDNLRQPPVIIEDIAETQGKATSAEGVNMYVSGAVVAGVAVGLTYLYRKIRESR